MKLETLGHATSMKEIVQPCFINFSPQPALQHQINAFDCDLYSLDSPFVVFQQD